MSEIGVDRPPSEAQQRIVKGHISKIGIIAFPLALTAVGAILLGLFLSILKLNNGTFVYSMDDPYIGLALSDQIRHGNYGMNSGLHAAPSSSILYPFLLAPASGTLLHPYLPLMINTLALFATLVIIWRLFTHLGFAQDTFGMVAQAIALLLLAVCLNLIGVVFTGLEHNLHIMMVALTIYGLALFLDKGKMPAWLPAVIVLSPMLRYEGIALSLAALMVLALRGRWRTALGILAIIIFFMGGFSAFLVHLGLPPLPSSVLSKSDVAANGINGADTIFFHSIVQNTWNMAFIPIGALLLVIGVAAASRCLLELPVQPRRWSAQGLMALLLLCLIGAHSAAGQFGWMDRYEDYALAGTVLIGMCLMREMIRNALLNKKTRLIYFCGTAVALIVFCLPYIRSITRVPLAANNIYEQQFQMHRFVNDFYRGPVAVNDLGLISYHNPNFVLDLGGLASEKARILKASDASAEEYRAFVAGGGVHLVIIYDEWFPDQIPASWIKVASMDLSRERVSSAQEEVQFYAADDATASQLRPELQSFSRSLPLEVNLTIYGPAGNHAQ
jgi:hypothetical protein